MKPCPNCQRQPISFARYWRGLHAGWTDCRHCGRPLKANKITWLWLLACVAALIGFFVALFANIDNIAIPSGLLKAGLAVFVGACAILAWFTGGYERDTFAEKHLAPSPDMPACPKCGQPLRSPKAQQCLECGADWHE